MRRHETHRCARERGGLEPGRTAGPDRRPDPAGETHHRGIVGRDAAGRARRAGPDPHHLGRPEAQRRDLEPVYPGGGGRLRHARCADHPPRGQPDRLDHARRGYRARVSGPGLRLRDNWGRGASGVAPGGEAGRHAVRVQLLPRDLPHRLHVPALPDREAAIATLAPGRRGRLPADGPDPGRAGRDATVAAAARAGRYIAGLPESGGRRESEACPASGPRRHHQWAGGGLRRVHGGGAGVARRPVPGRAAG